MKMSMKQSSVDIPFSVVYIRNHLAEIRDITFKDIFDEHEYTITVHFNTERMKIPSKDQKEFFDEFPEHNIGKIDVTWAEMVEDMKMQFTNNMYTAENMYLNMMAPEKY